MAQTHEDRQQGGAIAGERSAQTSPSLPVLMLTVLGTLITVLGLFAGGEIALVIVGLVAIAVAGLIHVFRPGR